MGWLFGSKKAPKVPLPEAGMFDEHSLHFPVATQSRTIIPEYHEDEDNAPISTPTMPSASVAVKRGVVKGSVSSTPVVHRHFYLKVDTYQQILADLDGLKKDLGHLGEVNRLLEASEFNEEADYDKIKRGLKLSHDKLVSIDKVLFSVRR